MVNHLVMGLVIVSHYLWMDTVLQLELQERIKTLIKSTTSTSKMIVLSSSLPNQRGINRVKNMSGHGMFLAIQINNTYVQCYHWQGILFVYCIVFSLIHLFLFHTLIKTIFCLLLSITVADKVFCCFLEVMHKDSPLFEGSGQYDRYSKIFHNRLKIDSDLFEGLGYKEGNRGVHSCRKGVATMVTSGCTVSHPIVSVCIQCGWVMGGVKDRYLKYEAAGDQYVGQCATGKSQLSTNFAKLTPYFDFLLIANDDEADAMQMKVESWIFKRLGEFNISPETKAVATMCFASICYHYTFLKNSLSPLCPLQA